MKSRKTKKSKTKGKKTVEIPVKYLRALRRAVGLQIDPDTAEWAWIDSLTDDPYGDHRFRAQEKQVGREYFARSSGIVAQTVNSLMPIRMDLDTRSVLRWCAPASLCPLCST